MTLSTLKQDSGFTLVELLITLLVGAVMVTGLNAIVVSQSFLGERSRDLVLANSFVEGKFESLRSLGFLGLNDGTTDITSELPTELNNPRSGNMAITPLSSGTKKITITVTYNEQGQPRTYSYSTLIGELGVGQY